MKLYQRIRNRSNLENAIFIHGQGVISYFKLNAVVLKLLEKGFL